MLGYVPLYVYGCHAGPGYFLSYVLLAWIFSFVSFILALTFISVQVK